MPYLNLDFDYFEHPKTLRMVALLGPGGESVPLRLWAKVGKFYAKDGVLQGYAGPEIESLIGWRGKPGKAVESLLKVGFLEEKGQKFFVHDWKEHQGHIWAIRERNRKASNAKWKAIRDGKTIRASGSACGIPDANQNDANAIRGESPIRSVPFHSDPTLKKDLKAVTTIPSGTILSPETARCQAVALKRSFGELGFKKSYPPPKGLPQ